MEQLLEDAPYETLEVVKKQWETVSRMQSRGSAGWEDWVDPCVAMGCLGMSIRRPGVVWMRRRRIDGERRLRVFRRTEAKGQELLGACHREKVIHCR